MCIICDGDGNGGVMERLYNAQPGSVLSAALFFPPLTNRHEDQLIEHGIQRDWVANRDLWSPNWTGYKQTNSGEMWQVRTKHYLTKATGWGSTVSFLRDTRPFLAYCGYADDNVRILREGSGDIGRERLFCVSKCKRKERWLQPTLLREQGCVCVCVCVCVCGCGCVCVCVNRPLM